MLQFYDMGFEQNLHVQIYVQFVCMALVDGKQVLKVGDDSTIFSANSSKSGPLVKLAPCKRLLSMNTC
jgi:hypothetical protein